MKFIDFDLNVTYKKTVKETFEYNGRSWRNYYKDLVRGSFLNEIDFEYEDIDRTCFVLYDGGEGIRLKNGTWIVICWRGSECRVWKETNTRTIRMLNKLYNA